MNIIEKIYSVFAILFALGLIVLFSLAPESRQLKILLPVSLAGMGINIGLMFIVLKDIFFRSFNTHSHKYIWIAAVLLFWPVILYYLPKYGFRSR